MQMLSAFAEHERAVIRERIRNGQDQKAAQGLWVGGRPPYGYRLADGSVLIVGPERRSWWPKSSGATSNGSKGRGQSRCG